MRSLDHHSGGAAGEPSQTPSVQDYAKAIYALGRRSQGPVSTNDLAERLNVTPGSVSAMLRKLSELEIVQHRPYHGVELTDQGRRVALGVLRSHRLLETFLVDKLKMPMPNVHAEAEALEHAVSAEFVELLDDFLGNPQFDPHGDPIPNSAFEVDERDAPSLAELPAGSAGRFVRVSDSEPDMLRYLAEQRIELHAHLEVLERQPFGGPVFVRVGEREHALGGQIAQAMRVELDAPGRGE